MGLPFVSEEWDDSNDSEDDEGGQDSNGDHHTHIHVGVTSIQGFPT